jgi:hypothetical protein
LFQEEAKQAQSQVQQVGAQAQQQAEAQLCCSSVAALLQAQQAEAQLCCSFVAALLQAQQAEAQAQHVGAAGGFASTACQQKTRRGERSSARNTLTFWNLRRQHMLAYAAHLLVCAEARNTLTLSWPMSKICSLRNLRRRNTIAYAAHPLAYAEARTLLWPMNKICSLAYAAHPLAYAEARALLWPMSKICSLREKKDL